MREERVKNTSMPLAVAPLLPPNDRDAAPNPRLPVG